MSNATWARKASVCAPAVKSRIYRSLALAIGLSSFAAAANATTVIQLPRKENGYSAPAAYAAPVDIVYDNLTTPTHIEGAATLTLEVTGNFDGASEKLEIYIENTLVGTVLDGVQPSAICHNDGTSLPTLTTVSISIDAAVLNPLIADGKTDMTLKPTSPGFVCYDDDNPCYSLRVGSGVFSLNEALSPVEEKTLNAASLSKSRTSVTLSNLPNLSGRLARVSFRSSPAAPRAPSPSAPVPTTPTSSAPSSISPGGALPGAGGSSGGGVVISGGGTSSAGNFSFSGDLYSMRSASVAREAARRVAHYGESRQATAYRMRNAVDAEAMPSRENEAASVSDQQVLGFDILPQDQAFDVWFGGSFSYFDSELGGVGQTGGVGSLQAGVDTRISNDVLLGFAVFGDLLRSDSSTGSQSHGLGVMAGPYAVIGLHENLYLELMGAYGRAFNRINTQGVRDARYQSQRLLATARLSGDWVDGPWSIRPSARVTYYSELQESFDAGDGTVVEEEESVLGQLRFGPELGHNITWDGGYARPFMGIEGVWAFKQTEQSINGAQVVGEDMTGSFSFGVDALLEGASLRAAGRYDGIGEPTLDAVSGEITLRMPLD